MTFNFKDGLDFVFTSSAVLHYRPIIRCQDTLDSRHIGTSAGVSYGHFGTKEDILTVRRQAALDQAMARLA